MMTRKTFLMFALSAVLALLAAFFARTWLNERMAAAEADESERVVVAALKIDFGQRIEEPQVRVIRIPEESVPSNVYNDPADVVGKIATNALVPGEIILKERLADNVSGSALAALVEPDKRAVTVRVNDVIGVAGFLLPGNRVDVVGTERNGGNVKADTIVENVKVLAVDQTAASDKNEPVIVRAVTLQMTPDEAEELVKATDEGGIQLTLRNPDDNEKVNEKKAEAKPKPRPNPYRLMTVIRGTDVSRDRVR